MKGKLKQKKAGKMPSAMAPMTGKKPMKSKVKAKKPY